MKILELRILPKKSISDLEKSGIETLFDDRNSRAGEKFADSDFIGIPIRIVVSEKTLADNDSVEIKLRKTGDISKVSISDLISEIHKIQKHV